ncbi:hypothetical protein FPZ43_15705 [Mucilaginibacter pallidiroseus]|uniref:Uncharacterized protein n=1 Tax=Mucilaginibacter pallidiroseus TaxID=2599295 RepID=A0A563U321_9SPHI|nr:hypothetical protein [Mucilaginibacter pallidiroseus]TWR25730.1 hypothetical protein FPZ43_15705 [Mucilaginibacter pallidiroseus]
MEQKPLSQDDIDKAKAYKEALDELQKSVVGLNSKLPSFADGMKAGIQAIGEKLPEVVESIKNLNEQNRQLAESGGKPKNILKELASSMLSWNTLISVGVTLLATYGDAIIDWVSSLGKGKDASNQSKLSIESLNKAVGSTEYSGAIKQVNELKINVGLAKDGFLKKQDVLRQYNDTLGKTMGHADTLNEVEGKLLKNGPAYIKMTLYKATAQMALQEAAKKAVEAEQIKLKKDEDVLTFWDKTVDFFNRNTGAAGIGAAGMSNTEEIADAELKAKANQRRKEEGDQIQKDQQNLVNIAATYQKLAAEVANGNGLNFVGSTTTEILKKDFVRKHNIITSHAEQLMQAKSIDFAQTLELNKNQYDLELKQLDGLLRDKEISQEEFNKRSERLQHKYKQNIGNNAELFAKQNMADMKKAMDVLAGNLREKEGQQKKDVISQDEKELRKIKLPGNQLAAERKLIDDKFAYELFMAGNNSEKKKAIEEKHQKDLSDLSERYEQQRKEFAVNTAQKVADAAFSLLGSNIKANTEAKIKGLEKDKANELSNTSLTSTQRKAVEEKYKKKEEQEKIKAFKAEQRMSVLQAVVNGALAITKATSQTGVLAPFVIPGIIASTAVQIATIASQKPPQFAKGGQFISDGRGALLPGYSRTDNTNAYLRSGEAVVVSEAMRNPWARNLVSAINVAYGGRDFSMPNPGKGYSIGDIYTDGGNANRYYSQPVVDVKEMANTLAYQMINNFPPIYVDVKDVNNQQNILAQTVNRVNL